MTENVGRVAGHGLRSEGRPYSDGRQSIWAAGSRGHGLCECGELSPVLPSDAARKRWHKEHKAEVLRGARMETGEAMRAALHDRARMEMHGR